MHARQGRMHLVRVSFFTVLVLLSSGPAGIADETVRLKAIVDSTATGRLGGGEVRIFEVDLTRGQYLKVSLQKGVQRLSLKLINPAGETIASQSSNRYEPLYLATFTEVSGRHRLEVRSLEQDATVRTFQLTLQELHPLTERDSQR